MILSTHTLLRVIAGVAEYPELDEVLELRAIVLAADAMRNDLVDTDYELLDDFERRAVDAYDRARAKVKP